MKAHKYWSMGALITMIGTFYTGYKGTKSSHRYFACSTLICLSLIHIYMEALGDQFIQEMHELSEKGGSKKIKQFEKDLEVAEDVYKRQAELFLKNPKNILRGFSAAQAA